LPIEIAPSYESLPSSASSTTEVQEEGQTSLHEKLYRGISSPMRLLPNFLIIGTQRGGTTSLYHYLKTHPCIAPATSKDTHFFDKKFSKGLSWYRGHFPTRLEKFCAEHLLRRPFVTGEASSSYLFHPHVPKRVARVLPQVKLIVLLRNPVDRAYSQYYHAIELGHETFSFEEAIQYEQERTARELEKILADEHYYSQAHKHLSYLSRGIYVDQLQAWMSLFPREQFLILKSEDFYADPATIVNQVLDFLNLPQLEAQLSKGAYKQYNNNTYPKMDAGLRKRLVDYFEPHNARLYDLLGVNFGWDH
jgi:Sulfotransferase domain